MQAMATLNPFSMKHIVCFMFTDIVYFQSQRSKQACKATNRKPFNAVPKEYYYRPSNTHTHTHTLTHTHTRERETETERDRDRQTDR